MNKKKTIEVDGKRYTAAAYEELSGYKVCTCCKETLSLSSFLLKRKDTPIGKSGKFVQVYNSICKVCNSKGTCDYYLRNRDRKLDYQKKQNRLKINEYRPRMNSHKAAYRASSRNATPAWITKEDEQVMRSLYKQREELSLVTGLQHQVDHIIPLNGLSVCGLHVPWNLQVIPKEQNARKSNQLDHELLQELYVGYSQTEITTELYISLKEHNPRLKFMKSSEISETIIENP